MMSGIFSITSPTWLLAKLERDLKAFQVNPCDADKAFDFFITAESLVDWLMPGNENRQTRTKLKESDPLLQVVSHLASQAKHYVAEASCHKSVKGTRRAGGGLFSGGLYAGKLFAGKLFPKGGGLTVEFSGVAADLYGTSIAAVTLAELVLQRMTKLVSDWTIARG